MGVQSGVGVSIVGKKWKPRNPVNVPFSAKIRKVEAIRKICRRLEKLAISYWGSLERDLKNEKGVHLFLLIRKIRKNSESSPSVLGKLEVT